MTAIVGLIQDGEVWMGADSYCEDGALVYTRATPKIFSRKEPNSERRLLFGVAGYPLLHQIIRYKTVILSRPAEMSADEYIVDLVSERIIDATNKHLERVGKKNKKWPNARILIAYDGQIYSLDQNHFVMNEDNGLIAVGWGAEVATGALEATQGMSASERIERALAAAAKHTSKVTRPFHIEKL